MAGSATVLLLLLLLGGMLLLMEVVRNAINWVRTVQAELLQDHITSLIHEKSVTADLAFYELSDYYDHLHRARAEARYRPVALLGNLGALLQNSITLAGDGRDPHSAWTMAGAGVAAEHAAGVLCGGSLCAG